MAERRRASGRQVRRRYAFDLGALAVYVLVTAVALAVVDDAPIRTLLGAPLVLFAPGYAIVALAFPVRTRDARAIDDLDRIERVVVAFGTSIAFVVVGTLLISPAFPGGLASIPFVSLLAATTLLVSIAAYARRKRYPPDERDGVGHPRRILGTVRTARLFDVVLVVAILLAVGTVGLGLAAPPADPGHTTVSLLTESGDGDLHAADYPGTVTRGDELTATVRVDNDEGAPETYTVVVVLERLDESDERVLQRQYLTRDTIAVDPGQSAARQLSVTPDTLGTDLRVSYYVYRGDVGDRPAPSDADRHVFLWVSVEPPENASVVDGSEMTALDGSEVAALDGSEVAALDGSEMGTFDHASVTAASRGA